MPFFPLLSQEVALVPHSNGSQSHAPQPSHCSAFPRALPLLPVQCFSVRIKGPAITQGSKKQLVKTRKSLPTGSQYWAYFRGRIFISLCNNGHFVLASLHEFELHEPRGQHWISLPIPRAFLGHCDCQGTAVKDKTGLC
jgi:hypothetical protein